MTREKAKKILRSWDGVYIGYSSDEVEEAHNMAIQALSQEPCDDCIFKNEWNKIGKLLSNILEKHSQKSGKWIPVRERLPEDGKWAIFTDGKNISVERFKLDAISHFFPNGRWFELEDAIAWMPLPKPYEPQESEDKE